MIKQAQLIGGALQGLTLSDLIAAIRRDPALSNFEQQRLISQIEGVTRGAPPSMPLTVLMAGGLGGVVGVLISKYFSMGPVGQTISAVVGYGLGKAVYNAFNRPPDLNPGWRFIE